MIIYYSTSITDDMITLTAEEHRHCSIVTRRRVGDQVYVTDGGGMLYHTEIESIGKRETSLRIISTTLQQPRSYELSIAIAPTKNKARIEWMVEKSVEIGIHRIYLLHTERGEKQRASTDRLSKIMISAMKQSKNLYLPQVIGPMTIDQVLEATSTYDVRCVAHCNDTERHLGDRIDIDKHQRILLCVGPEGDFSDSEIASMESQGLLSVHLGQSRLRTETAGVVGATIVAMVYDMGL